jgi:hypothetical protein
LLQRKAQAEGTFSKKKEKRKNIRNYEELVSSVEKINNNINNSSDASDNYYNRKVETNSIGSFYNVNNRSFISSINLSSTPPSSPSPTKKHSITINKNKIKTKKLVVAKNKKKH